MPHCVQVGRLRGLCLGRLEIDLKFIALYMHWNRSRLTTPTYFVVVGNKSKMNRIFSYSYIVLNPNWYRNFTSALHNRQRIILKSILKFQRSRFERSPFAFGPFFIPKSWNCLWYYHFKFFITKLRIYLIFRQKCDQTASQYINSRYLNFNTTLELIWVYCVQFWCIV